MNLFDKYSEVVSDDAKEPPLCTCGDPECRISQIFREWHVKDQARRAKQARYANATRDVAQAW